MNLATENEIGRLSMITARQTAEDLLPPLPNGWTIATKLAHLAFWDMSEVHRRMGMHGF
jgi:hypothetical protein